MQIVPLYLKPREEISLLLHIKILSTVRLRRLSLATILLMQTMTSTGNFRKKLEIILTNVSRLSIKTKEGRTLV
jgi:hypothetical protein